MSSDNTNSTRKFEEALTLLNEAARDKKQEIQDLMSNKFDHIKGAIQEASNQGRERFNRVREAAGEAYEVGSEKVKEAAKKVDENVHENPWAYIGGAAVAALLLGYILGASRNNK